MTNIKRLDCAIEGLQDKDAEDFMLAFIELVEKFNATVAGILRIDDIEDDKEE